MSAEIRLRDPASRPGIEHPPRFAALPYAAMALGVLALGFSAIFVRWAAAPGPVTGFYRMGLASVFLAPFALAGRTHRRSWPTAGIHMAALAGLFLAADVALWNTAVNLTSAANAVLFANTAPLWVALAAWLLLREKLNGRFWLALLLTLAGAALVLGTDFFRNPRIGWGDLLALAASLFYAGYFLITQRGREQLPPLPYVWLMGAISALTLLGISLALRLPLVGYPSQTYLAFLGLALVTQVVGYLAMGYALGHLPASLVSPTMVGQLLATALLAIPLLGEFPSLEQWLGGIGVIAGIVLVHRARQAA